MTFPRRPPRRPGPLREVKSTSEYTTRRGQACRIYTLACGHTRTEADGDQPARREVRCLACRNEGRR